MLVRVNVQVYDYKGEAWDFFTATACEKCGHQPQAKEPYTLRRGMINALLGVLQGDEKLNGEQKLKLFRLAETVEGNDEVELSAEDLALIKERIGRGMSAALLGSLYAAIEQPKPN